MADYIEWTSWDSESYENFDMTKTDIDVQDLIEKIILTKKFPVSTEEFYHRWYGTNRLIDELLLAGFDGRLAKSYGELANYVFCHLFRLGKPYEKVLKIAEKGLTISNPYTPWARPMQSYSEPLTKERVNIGGKTYIKNDEKRTLTEIKPPKKDSAFELTRKMIWAKTKDEEEKYFQLLLENYPEYV